MLQPYLTLYIFPGFCQHPLRGKIAGEGNAPVPRIDAGHDGMIQAVNGVGKMVGYRPIDGAFLKRGKESSMRKDCGRDRWVLWIVSVVLFFVLTGAGWASDTLKWGQILHRGTQLVSHNGRFRLDFQSDGNLVLYDRTQAIWSAGTQHRGGQRLVMQRDGNLVMYGPNGPVWATNTSGNPESYLKLQDDGNLVIYRPVWSTKTAR